MNLIEDFIALIFPNVCLTCNRQMLQGERFLCINCLSELPVTGYSSMESNPVSRTFIGRVEIKSATSWLHFEKGNKTQTILHYLKYKNYPEIGLYFGELMGKELKESNFYNDIDAIIPLPLHPSKRKKRGYNQSTYIATGIGRALDVEVDEQLLFRKNKTSSQTRKKRYERWENVQSVFSINEDRIGDIRHILLVDDVVTTGASIEACVQKLKEKSRIEISIATLARSG